MQSLQPSLVMNPISEQMLALLQQLRHCATYQFSLVLLELSAHDVKLVMILCYLHMGGFCGMFI